MPSIGARRKVVNFPGRYAICGEASDGGGGPLPNKVKKVSPGTDMHEKFLAAKVCHGMFMTSSDLKALQNDQ